jgi:hypothetical protein
VIAVGGSGRVKSLPGTKNVSIPSSAHHGDYMALISSLSDTDSPTLFGLPSNIDRAAQQVSFFHPRAVALRGFLLKRAALPAFTFARLHVC